MSLYFREQPLTWRRVVNKLKYQSTLLRSAIGYRLKHLGHRFISKGATRDCTTTINFYPQCPGPAYLIWKAACLCGLKIMNKPFGPGLNVYWIDTTYRPPTKASTTLNLNCLDISKSFLDEQHQAVFGYSAAIDPLTYQSTMVVKSVLNAKHDGKLVNGPLSKIELRPDVVYQRPIDSQRGDSVEDIRLPIINGKIPFAYLKIKDARERFSNVNQRVVMNETSELLSDEEVRQVLALASATGLDLGEMDAVRDRTDGRLYVVDVNSTPCGPPNHIDPISYQQSMFRYGTELLQLIRRAGSGTAACSSVSRPD